MEEKRPLGLVSLLALGVNGIVGVGIFFVPADLGAKVPGQGSVAAFAIVALLLVPVAWSFAKLGSRFDVDGGPVVYARAAFGELASFVVGWIAYVSAIASTAAVIDGLVRATPLFVGGDAPVGERAWTVGLVTALALLTATGISVSARAWTALTVLKLVPLIALLAAFAIAGGGTAPPPSPLPPASTLASAGLAITFAYQGFEIVPVVAGQAARSTRAIPIAVVGSLVLSAALYMLLQAACVRALPDLARSNAPLADAALVYGGSGLSRLVQIGTSVSALGIAVGMVAMTPRYLSALAVGGGVRGRLDVVDERGVPRRALFVTWIAVTVLLLTGTRSQLFAISSVAVLAQYVVTAISLVRLARRRERGLLPSDALVGIPAAVASLAIVASGRAREWIVAGIALAVGLLLRASAPRRSSAPR